MTAQCCKCGHRKNSHHLVKQKREGQDEAGREFTIYVTQSIVFKQKFGECSRCDCKKFKLWSDIE